MPWPGGYGGRLSWPSKSCGLTRRGPFVGLRVGGLDGEGVTGGDVGDVGDVGALVGLHPNFLGIPPENRYAGAFLFPSMRRTSFKLCKSSSAPEIWPASAVQMSWLAFKIMRNRMKDCFILQKMERRDVKYG